MIQYKAPPWENYSKHVDFNELEYDNISSVSIISRKDSYDHRHKKKCLTARISYDISTSFLALGAASRNLSPIYTKFFAAWANKHIYKKLLSTQLL